MLLRKNKFMFIIIMTSLRIYYKPLLGKSNIVEGWMVTPTSYDLICENKIIGPQNIYSVAEVSTFPKTIWKEIHAINEDTPALAILLWS